jgi:hypothetical protein
MPRHHRAQIESALEGEAPGPVPFSFYDLLFPPGFDPAPLQAAGMAICARRSPFRLVRPHVTVRETVEPDGSIRTLLDTPRGSLTTYQRRAALAFAPVEHPIRSLEDYRAAAFIVEDTQFLPEYDSFTREVERIGEAGKVIAHTCHEPLVDLQLNWIGQERFCYELADNPGALAELHESLVHCHRRMWEVVARSPADWVLYGGNIVPEMLDPERVRSMIAPCWNGFADILHGEGKRIGCHLDAGNAAIMDIVADSRLDLVEAFTPPPDCPVTVAEARAAWPGKRLWVNFPSSVHLQSDEEIRETVHRIVAEAGDRRGFLLGVTEDVPAGHLERSCRAILAALAEAG